MKQIFSDGYSILSPKSDVDSGIGSTLTRNLQTYGLPQAIQKSDIARPIVKAYEASLTVRALYSFSGISEAKTNHAIFDESRKAIIAAVKAQYEGKSQENPEVLAAAETFIQNIKNGKPAEVISGTEYTGFYRDLVEGQNAIEASIIGASSKSPESKLNFANLDFNNPDAMKQYMEDVRKYSKQIKLDEQLAVPGDFSSSFSQIDVATGATELKILLHLQDEKTYTKYVSQMESVIAKNFQDELQKMRQSVIDMGFNGNVRDNNALQSFASTRAPGEQAIFTQLIDANNANDDAVTKYILGNIATGKIDVENILATGKLNGVQLNSEALAVMQALNVYAHVDAITTRHHEGILKELGYDKKMKMLNLQNLDCMKERVAAFETALDKAGLSSINGKMLNQMSLKELQNIDFSKIDIKFHEGLKTYVSLKSHASMLLKTQRLKKMASRQAWSLFRKGLGNSDINRGYSTTRTSIRAGQIAFKVWMKVGAPLYRKFASTKLIRFMSSNVKKAFVGSAKFAKKFVLGGARKVWGLTKSVAQKMAPGAFKLAASAQSLAKRAKNKATEKIGRKISQQQAKRAQKKLLGKAGKRWGRKVKNKARKRAVRKKLGKVVTKFKNSALGKLMSSAKQLLKKVAMKLLVYVAIILAILVLISAACQLLSGVFMIAGETIMSIEDTVLGDFMKFFENFTWPWEADKEEVKSTLLLTIRMLQDEERRVSSLSGGLRWDEGAGEWVDDESSIKEQLGDKLIFYYGASIDNDGDMVLDNKIEFDDSIQFNFAFTSSGKYVTQHSIIKDVIATANVYSRDIEYESDLTKFTAYAVGLWRHMNTPSLNISLQICKNGCKEFTYCESDISDGLGTDLADLIQDVRDGRYYDNRDSRNECDALTVFVKETWNAKEYGDGYLWELYDGSFYNTDDIEGKQFFFLLDGYIKYEDNGETMYTLFNDDDFDGGCTREVYKQCKDKNCHCSGYHTEIYISNKKYATSLKSIANLRVDQYRRWDKCNATGGPCDGDHWLSTYNDVVPDIKYYKRIEEGTIHWKLEFSELARAVKNQCSGPYNEAIEDVVAVGNIAGYSVIIDKEHENIKMQVNPAAPHNCVTCADSCLELRGVLNKDVDENIAGFFSYCNNISECKNKGELQVKIAGKNYYIKVCLGHLECRGDGWSEDCQERHLLACPGHTLKYCTGHPIVKVKTSVKQNRDRLFDDDWTYESPANGWEDFFGDVTTWTPKVSAPSGQSSLAKDNWTGWSDAKKEDVDILAGDDWYTKYKFSMSEFVGGRCSEGERLALMKQNNIDISRQSTECTALLLAAFDAIGQIPYYPNGNPVEIFNTGEVACIPYPQKSQSSPYVNASRVSLGFKGVGYEYFASYIACVAGNHAPSNMPVNIKNISVLSNWTNKERVTAGITSPGAIIARQIGGKLQTAIYAGYNGTTMYFITMDESGWCSYQSADSFDGWVMWDSTQKLRPASGGSNGSGTNSGSNSGNGTSNTTGNDVTISNTDVTNAAFVLIFIGAVFAIMYISIKRNHS